MAPLLSLFAFIVWQMTPGDPWDRGSAWGYAFWAAILGAQYLLTARSGITLTPTDAVLYRPFHHKRAVPWADVETIVITRSPFGQIMLGTTSGEEIVLPVLTLNRRRLDAIRADIDQRRTEHREPCGS